jgi:hypothetical protein
MNGGHNGKARRYICKKCDASNHAEMRKDPVLYAAHCAYVRARHWHYVKLVFDHYGRRCECCGETEEKFLTVDHIVPIASYSTRVKLGQTAIYSWLVRNKFPEGFRILCSNCNHGRQRNGGICPHQMSPQARAEARSRECGEIPETLIN